MCCSWSRWWRNSNKEQLLLAALLGALVTIAVVGGISVSLAPAHVVFSIANATMTTTTSRLPVKVSSSSGDRLYTAGYRFTLVTNNTSRSTRVHYAMVSAQIWYSNTGYILAENVTRDEDDAANFTVWAPYGQYDERSKQPDTSTKQLEAVQKAIERDCNVVVEAKVWFKYGLAVTRLYTVRVTCFHVYFSNTTNNVLVRCM